MNCNTQNRIQINIVTTALIAVEVIFSQLMTPRRRIMIPRFNPFARQITCWQMSYGLVTGSFVSRIAALLFFSFVVFLVLANQAIAANAPPELFDRMAYVT
jgi:hypothetical protein